MSPECPDNRWRIQFLRHNNSTAFISRNDFGAQRLCAIQHQKHIASTLRRSCVAKMGVFKQGIIHSRIRILTFREVFVLNILELSVCINLFNYLS